MVPPSIFDDFDSFLPPFLARPTSSEARGRLNAKTLKELSTPARELKLNQSGENAVVGIPYGEVPVAGKVIGFAEDTGTQYFLVMWGMGPVHSVKTLFINDSTDFSGVTNLSIRHYLGRSTQPVDFWFGSFVAGYEDNLVVAQPDGVAGVCYSAIRIDTTWINDNGVPSFQAILKGRFCYDPDRADYLDSYYDDVGVEVLFEGADSTAPTNLDSSLNELPVTYIGGATIQGNELSCNGTSQGASIANHPALRPGPDPWSITILVTPDVVTADNRAILTYGNFLVGRFGMSITRTNSDLNVQLSSNGTSADLLDVSVASMFNVGVETRVTVEYTGQAYMVLVDGTHRRTVMATGVVFANSTDSIDIGHALGAFLFWEGTIKGFQCTFGSYRFGAGVDSTKAGYPWLDSGTYEQGYVWSANSGLCAAEFITNPFYGRGVPVADVQGIKAVKDLNDTLLGGLVPKGRLSLLITQPKKTQEYIDLLSTYASCFNVPEESGYALIPDQPPTKSAPSGQQHILHHKMQSDPFDADTPAWVSGGSEWSYDAGIPAIVLDGSQVAPTELATVIGDCVVGEMYAVKLTGIWGASGVGDSLTILLGQAVVGTQTSGESGEAFELYFEFEAVSEVSGFTVRGDSSLTVSFTTVSVRSFKWIERYIEMDSLRIKGISDSSTPTKTSVTYKESSEVSANWADKVESYTLSEAQSGDIPLIETTLTMKGIFTGEEAYNKAESSTLRLKGRNEYSWTSLDAGIALRVGTVVKLLLEELVQDVMLLSAKMTNYGRYAVRGETFSISHYPDSIKTPEQTGSVPIGAVGMLASDQTPGGDWQSYAGANGFYMVGYDPNDPSYDIGETLGQATYAGWSGNTTIGGGHRGGSTPSIRVRDRRNTSGSSNVQSLNSSNNEGEHLHPYDTGVVTPDLFRRRVLLSERVTSPGLKIPKEIMVFGMPGLSAPGLTRLTTLAGRVIRVSSIPGNGGQAQQFITLTTGSSTMPLHTHKSNFSADISLGFPEEDEVYEETAVIETEHEHEHEAVLRLFRSIKRLGLALYSSSADYDVIPGMMLFWKDAAASLLSYPDWSFCTGRLGTPNASKRLFEVAALGNENREAGDNTLRLEDGVKFDPGHDHLDNEAEPGTAEASVGIGHTLWKHKDHTIVGESSSWTPPSKAIGLIMYNPSPNWANLDLKLLLGGGGANGSTTIVDSGPSALVPDAVANLAYDNSVQFFSSTAIKSEPILFDSGLEYDNLLSNLVNGRFTFATWVVAGTVSPLQFIISTERDNGGNDYFELEVNVDGDLMFIYNGTTQITAVEDIQPNVEMFIAVVWDSNEFRLYSGTVESGTVSLHGSYTPTTPVLNDNVTLLNNSVRNAGFTGWVEDLYIVDGVAQFTEAVEFIPPQPPRG